MKWSLLDWIGLCLAIVLLVMLAMVISTHWPPEFSISKPWYLLASLALLLAGMATQFAVWHASVSAHVGHLPCQATFCSHALTIWAKYIPGKVWSIFGRASFLAYTTDHRMPPLMLASSTAQLSMIVGGLAVSLPLLDSLGMIDQFAVQPGGFALGLALALVIVLLALVPSVLLTLRRGPEALPPFFWVQGLMPTLLALLTWMCWGLGFHFLLAAAGITSALLEDIAAFAAGTTAGVLAVVAPGGMGVREGAISGILHVRGFDWGQAAVIAIGARVWFVVGEACVFMLGWQVRRYCRSRR